MNDSDKPLPPCLQALYEAGAARAAAKLNECQTCPVAEGIPGSCWKCSTGGQDA